MAGIAASTAAGAEKYIGERIDTTYAFRSLIDARATIAFGSDWFVAPPTPLAGIYAAVTRRTLDDRNPAGWVLQKITVEGSGSAGNNYPIPRLADLPTYLAGLPRSTPS